MTLSDKRECDSAIFKLQEEYLYGKYKNNSIVDSEEAKIQSSIILNLCDEEKIS